MKELTFRQYLLIKTLNEHAAPMISNSLCDILHISPRTLRYEIKSIHETTKIKMISSGKNGYYIENNKDTSKYFNDIKINSYLDTYKLITLLLLENEKNNIYDLEEKCFSSQSSISTDLKNISLKLRAYNITIERKGNYIYTSGEESDKRRMLAHFFYSEINSLANETDNFENYFTHFKLIDLHALVIECLNEIHVDIDNIYFKNIVINLAIALQRIMDGYTIDTSIVNEDNIDECIEFPFIKTFVDKANKKFNILITPNDFVCMQNFITGSFKDKNNGKELEILNNIVFKEKIKSMLDLTFAHFKITIDSSGFFDNFVLHIHYLLIRARKFGFFKNDISQYLQYTHPYVYDIAVYLTILIEEEFAVNIDADEIGLITIYLCTVIDDTITYEQAKAVYICPNYNTLRELFISQITSAFSSRLEIVDTITSYYEINKNISYDFIITTAKNEYILDNAIYVSSIITAREIHTIEKKIKEVFNEKKKKKIKNELLSYFDKDLFFHNLSFTKDVDILNYINQKLLSLKIAPEFLLDNTIKREKKASTAFFNKFAIPHALDVNSYQTKISYYYSEKPIDWFGQKINLILLLTSKEYDENFSEIYNLLFDILMDNSLYQTLISNRTFDELIDFIAGKK